MGGGYGIDDRTSEARPTQDFTMAIVPAVQPAHGRLAIKPGRVITGNAGRQLSRVLYTKQSGDKRF
jgi:diaminopimelate decarboxylase